MTFVKYYPVQKTRKTNCSENNDWSPAYDVVEYDDKFVLEVDLPGFAKSDFNINVKDGVLTVSGERQEKKYEDNNLYHYYGRPRGSFERSFRLNDRINEDKLKASYENGILRLDLPKRDEVKPRTIEIG
ncbi:Hsp20/alpha crystallin family protein [Candidatus Latescibacterota bacterium]